MELTIGFDSCKCCWKGQSAASSSGRTLPPQLSTLVLNQRACARGATAHQARKFTARQFSGNRALFGSGSAFDPDEYDVTAVLAAEEQMDADDYELPNDSSAQFVSSALEATHSPPGGSSSTPLDVQQAARRLWGADPGTTSQAAEPKDVMGMADEPPMARVPMSRRLWSIVLLALALLRRLALRTLRALRSGAAAAWATVRHPGRFMSRCRSRFDAAVDYVLWLWDRPPVQKLRLTLGLANMSIRLPAILAILATQLGLPLTSLSIPTLAPLLLGVGMMLRSLRTYSSAILPTSIILWMIWAGNSVAANTISYLRKQGALDARVSGAITTACEILSLIAAILTVLINVGVNVSALLLPAGIALAFAARDMTQNFLAGLFLFTVQPFKLGDQVAVSSPGAPGAAAGPWFEGTCEKVDLRYTVIRSGRRRMMVPNSTFLHREFVIIDDVQPSHGGGLLSGKRRTGNGLSKADPSPSQSYSQDALSRTSAAPPNADSSASHPAQTADYTAVPGDYEGGFVPRPSVHIMHEELGHQDARRASSGASSPSRQ